MRKSDEIKVIKDDLLKEGVEIEWLHSESKRIGEKLMQQYPNTWQKEMLKIPKYCAIVELIKEKKK